MVPSLPLSGVVGALTPVVGRFSMIFLLSSGCCSSLRHYACMCALSGTVCGCARCDTPRNRRCALCACHPRRHWCSHCCAFGSTCCCQLCRPNSHTVVVHPTLFRSHFSHMFSLYSHGILGVVFTENPSSGWYGAIHILQSAQYHMRCCPRRTQCSKGDSNQA